MSTTIERLRRLRLQAGATAPPLVAESTNGAIPAATPVAGHACEISSLVNEDTRQPSAPALEQLRRLLHRVPQLASRSVGGRSPGVLQGEETAPGLRYIERCYAQTEFDDLLPPRWPITTAVPRERFLCFDTETTGLAGGSGTRAFMIGAADWHAGALRVRQLYMTTMAAETAMLVEFSRWLDDSTVLVSYNGRSYDAPLLTTRYRMQRLACPLRHIAHVDLLHPVRRRYRGVWENCRLATIERHALQILREDDLPGAQAPAAWLGFLRGGPGTNLMRVLEHNRQDVVTLARLLEHMAAVAPGPATQDDRGGIAIVQG